MSEKKLIQYKPSYEFKNFSESPKILISQPMPASNSSPYILLSKDYGLEIEYRKFSKIIPLEIDNEKLKGNIEKYTAIILTSRSIIDYFFKIIKKQNIEISSDTKYFCLSEQIANYLQKYTQIKKRKLFYQARTVSELIPLFKKHLNENFLYPCPEIRKNILSEYFKKTNTQFEELPICKTVADDLSDIDIQKYNVIVFFSSADVDAFQKNFPDIKSLNKKFATFGPQATNALKLKIERAPDIIAPSKETPSMAMALKKYLIKKH